MALNLFISLVILDYLEAEYRLSLCELYRLWYGTKGVPLEWSAFLRRGENRAKASVLLHGFTSLTIYSTAKALPLALPLTWVSLSTIPLSDIHFLIQNLLRWNEMFSSCSRKSRFGRRSDWRSALNKRLRMPLRRRNVRSRTLEMRKKRRNGSKTPRKGMFYRMIFPNRYYLPNDLPGWMFCTEWPSRVDTLYRMTSWVDVLYRMTFPSGYSVPNDLPEYTRVSRDIKSKEKNTHSRSA